MAVEETAAGASMEAANLAEETGFFADPHSWVLIAGLLFLVVVYLKGRKPILAYLDARSARIKADLDEAARLKDEAATLLADYKKKQSEAVATAQKIIDNANEAALQIQKNAEAKLSESLKRREELLIERISRAEAAAVQELRHQAADIAARGAEKLLADNMLKNGAKLIDDAIDALPGRAA